MMNSTKIGPLRVRPHIRGSKPSGRWQLDVPGRFTLTGRRDRILFASKTDAVAEAKSRLREIQLKGAIRGHTPASRFTPAATGRPATSTARGC